MAVPVVQVGVVRVSMPQPPVLVHMVVRPARLRGTFVRVLVVLVVHVLVRMRDRLVHVVVLVALAQVQPHADAHQQSRRKKLNGHRLAQEDYRRESAQKRRR